MAFIVNFLSKKYAKMYKINMKS